MKLLFPLVSVIATTAAACLAVLGYRFARLPGWRDQRWLWLLAASASAYTAFNALVTVDAPAWMIATAAHGKWAALSLHVITWNLHGAARHHVGRGAAERALMAAVAIVGFASLFPGVLLEERIVTHHFLDVAHHEPPTTRMGLLAVAPLYAGFVLPFAKLLRKTERDRNARRYVVALVVFTGLGTNDVLASTGRYPLPYLLDVGFLVMVGLIWSALMDRLTRATHRLDVLSTQLEGIVTERTRELARAHEALVQAERLAAVGRLSAGVAHEINNPSAAVVSNLNYLKDALGGGRVPPDAREAIDDSLASLGKISRIVRQLLDTGRVAGAEGSVRSTFNVAEAVEHAVQTALASLERPLKATLEVPAIFGAGDRLMVEQVLVNLIVNGAQAVPPTREPRITIRAEKLTSGVRVSVADNGSGMSEQVARRAFEPFFTTKPIGKGTGLGLSVSLGLAKAVGGDLCIVRTSSEGTTMQLLLRSSLRLSSVPPPVARPGARPSQRVLIIDDDPVVREGLSRMLSRAFQVATASGVRDAQQQVESSHFDAILCDVMMDEGGGEALYDWLRRERPQAASRVIFVTGGITDHGARRFLGSQSQPVLYKPVDLITIERAVDEVALNERLAPPAAPEGA